MSVSLASLQSVTEDPVHEAGLPGGCRDAVMPGPGSRGGGACHLSGGRTERVPPIIWGKAGPAEGTAGPERRGRGEPGARGWGEEQGEDGQGVRVSRGGPEGLEFNSESDEKPFGSCERGNDGV